MIILPLRAPVLWPVRYIVQCPSTATHSAVVVDRGTRIASNEAPHAPFRLPPAPNGAEGGIARASDELIGEIREPLGEEP